jgi:hypothetical protein
MEPNIREKVSYFTIWSPTCMLGIDKELLSHRLSIVSRNFPKIWKKRWLLRKRVKALYRKIEAS